MGGRSQKIKSCNPPPEISITTGTTVEGAMNPDIRPLMPLGPRSDEKVE